MKSARIIKRVLGLWLLVLALATGLPARFKEPQSCLAQSATKHAGKPSQELVKGWASQALSQKIASLTPRGWEIFDKVKHFTAQDLYERINGRAEFFLAYDMIRMTFASFISRVNKGQFIDLSIYDMRTPTNAFGVFSGERAPGEQPVRLGRAGYRSDANFFIWKGRYYIRIISSEATEEFKKIGMDLAGTVTGFLQDSGEPVWGLATLPRVDRVPGSVQYVKVDAMGLDFMRDTYLARYHKGKVTVAIFLSRRETPETAKGVVGRYAEYARKYGKGVDRIRKGPVELVTCDMGGNYDVIFQKGRLVGGVASVDDRTLAVQVAIDLWRKLRHE